MKEEIIKKIDTILYRFSSIDSELWDIDTNIINTWELFRKYLNENFSFDSFCFESSTIERIKIIKNTNYWIFKINNINLTPSKTCHNGWSQGGIRQFLDVGKAFGFFFYDKKQIFKSKISTINNSSQFSKLLGNNFEWSQCILELIIRSLWTNSKEIKDLGFSIFYCLLGIKFDDYFKESNEKIELKKRVKRKVKESSTKDFNKQGLKYWYSNSEYGFGFAKEVRSSYKGCIEKLQEIDDEEIIDYIYNSIINNSEECLKYYIDKHYYNDTIRVIENNRRGFKFILLKNRKQLDNQFYSDLQYQGNYLEPYIGYVEAAHIYDVKEIKMAAKNNIDNKNEIISFTNNPNNGLLLDSNIHILFDKRIFEFDINGKIIYQNENEEILKRVNLINAKIKQSVLTKEMINFLKMRN